MLVVKVELWPFGDESRMKELARGFIWNDATGTSTRGNYQFVLKDGRGRKWKTGTVTDFPRTKLLGWDLLLRALYSVLAGRNGLENLSSKVESQLSYL